jgi:hypothetical protein
VTPTPPIDIGVSPSVSPDPPSPGVVVRMPITFLGMAPGRRGFEPEEFIRDPLVVRAVQAIRGAPTDAERTAAVYQLMETLG